MKSVRVRGSALLVALCLMGAASGCRTNVGAAATVGASRISEDDVSKYVGPAGTTPNTRPLIVNYSIKEKLYARALALKGAKLSEAELRSLQVVAAQQILGAQVSTAAEVMDSLVAGLSRIGVTAAFAPIVLRSAELEYAFALSSKATNDTALIAATKALHIPVSISPRYGSWSSDKLQILEAPTPDFLTTSPSPSPAQ